MLHEVYAPRDVASVAWSRRKVSEFQQLVTKVREGNLPLGPILLYGPTGCGKLSSALAILQEPQRYSSKGDDSCSLSCSHVRVLHTCDASPREYHHFLMNILSDGGGSDGIAVGCSDRSPATSSLERNDSDNKCSSVSHVVKFYGEAATSPFHSVTLQFLNYYYAYRHDVSSNNVFFNFVGGAGLSSLRRQILVLIFTTHDTHSDKVALGKLLPSNLLNHPCLHVFHCPPLTERSVTACIKRVLSAEKRKRGKERGNSVILSDEEIGLLSVQSHGDIRHALLQTQWSLLSACNSTLGDNFKAPKAAQKRRRSPQPTAHGVRSIEDLLSCDFDDRSNSVAPSTVPTEPKGADVLGENGDSNSSKCLDEDAEGLSVFRDDYLGVSHAAARVLTQKYTIDSVIQLLNVEPDKFLGYLTNNMLSYFLPEDMEPCTLTAAAASFSDALRASGTVARFNRNIAGVFTSSVTGDGENEGAGPADLRLISLLLFGKAYTTHHTKVYIPNVFGAKRPPPYYPLAYPRLREISATANRLMYDDNDPSTSKCDLQQRQGLRGSLLSSENEWCNEFVRRMKFHSTCGENQIGPVLDIVRESLPSLLDRCSSLDTMILDYMPYARWIVLNYSLSASSLPLRTTAVGTWTSANGIAGATPSSELRASAAHSGPKRTMFTGLQKLCVVNTDRPRRRCSSLRYYALSAALRKKTPIREENFLLLNEEDDFEDYALHDSLGGTAAGRSGEYCWLPEGEVIEDFSD